MAQCTVALDNVLGCAEEDFCRGKNDTISTLYRIWNGHAETVAA